jgi:hypothetical protein
MTLLARTNSGILDGRMVVSRESVFIAVGSELWIFHC